MHRSARLTASILALLFLGCAGQPPTKASSGLPQFQEFKVSPQVLADAATEAIRSSRYGLELDTRRSTPNSLITFHRPLPLRSLKALAYPGRPGLRGQALYADLHLQLSIRPSYARPDYSRVTIQPVRQETFENGGGI